MDPLVVDALPNRRYQIGAHQIAERAIPVGYSVAKIEVDRSQWLDPAVKVAFRFDLSLDGGETWTLGYVAFTAQGGPLQPPSIIPGAPDSNKSAVTTDIPQPDNPNRRTKAQLTLSGDAVTIDCVLTLT